MQQGRRGKCCFVLRKYLYKYIFPHFISVKTNCILDISIFLTFWEMKEHTHFKLLPVFPTLSLGNCFFEYLETKKSWSSHLNVQLRNRGTQSTILGVMCAHGPDRSSWRMSGRKLKSGSWTLKCRFLNKKRTLILGESTQVNREHISS